MRVKLLQFKMLDDLNIDYVVRLARRNKITIRVNPNGKVSISVPRLAKVADVNQVIEKNLDWIKKTREKFKQPKRFFVTGEKYLFLGKEYRLDVVLSKYEKVIISGDTIFIYTISDANEHKAELIRTWLQDMMEMTFSEMFNQCFQEMEAHLKTYPKLQIKNYKSRWGCCYPKRNAIILNDKLIHLPLHLIRYIIIHEMSHLLYPSHNQDFHAFLQTFIPEESKCRSELKKYSVYYE